MKYPLRIIFWLLAVLPQVAAPYDPVTHEDLSEAAVNASLLRKDSRLLETMGLEPLGEEQRFSINGFDRKTIIDHLREGSRFEDNGTRAINHFFDPLNDRGLSLLSLHGFRSPDWALEDRGEFNDQGSSLRDARSNLYSALTASSGDERERQFGLMFEKLGQVIHHLQDMAQPQHTRNDQHLDFPFLKIPGLENPSHYETHTREVQGDRAFTALLSAGSYPNVGFSGARKFWHTPEKNPTADQGIAEFTNANFLSAGTNFETIRYTYPRFEDAVPYDEPAEPLLRSVGADLPPECVAPNRPCFMVFFRSPVIDNYRPEKSGVNERASTLSIFDQDLKVNGKTVTYTNPDTDQTYASKDAFTLNRFNFDAAHEFLIPRAVAYSAGLIDYFFRGRLEAEDVEFTATGVRLRVKNGIDAQKTPAWKNEVMYAVNGNLAIAFEYRNSSGARQYGVSEPVGLAENLAPGQVSQNVYSFTLSIPSAATEIKHRLVFRGRMGEEEDAVGVGSIPGVSGFLVTPNYVPADGIVGPRLISNVDGQWKLSAKSGLQAGNIDWKGGYKDDVASYVLTWSGPRTRYFRDTTLAGRFDRRIYRDGETFAIAPGDVLGAAVTKDATGVEWLLAMCRISGQTLYRRPFTKSASPALYDPLSAPDGWQQVASFTGVSGFADTPYFFNSSGTEAQTMLRRSKIVGTTPRGDLIVQYDGLSRVKVEIDINTPSAVMHDLGNFDGITIVNERHAKLDPYCHLYSTGRGQYPAFDIKKDVRSGRYVIAVDYRKDEEILAVLSDTRSRSEEIHVDGEVCRSRQKSVAIDNRGELSLEIGSDSFVLMQEHTQAAGSQSITASPPFFNNWEGEVDWHRTEERVSTTLYHIDLRYAMAVQERTTYAQSEVVVGTINGYSHPPGSLIDQRGRVFEVESDVLNKVIFSFEQTQSGGSVAPFRDPESASVEGSVDVDEASTTVEKPDPAELIYTAVGGAWVVDGSAKLAASQVYGKPQSLFGPSGTRTDVFNFLHAGDMKSLVPGAPDDTSIPSRYFPIRVIK